MTYVAGIDIGSIFCKAVILKRDTLVSSHIMSSGKNYRETAERVMQVALDKAGLTREEIALTLATGYGATNVSSANQRITEISCQARGIRHLFPSVKTIIDIGGQSTKVIKLDEAGRAIDFAVSEKCAAGSGRFLQVIAKVLDIPLEDLGTLSLRATKIVEIATSCAVFTESEVVSRVAEGERKEDILAGVHAVLADKVVSLMERVKSECDYALTGGGAKDIGLAHMVQEKIAGERIKGALENKTCQQLVPQEPQITAALGAALFAWDRALEKASVS